ncbi:Hypothetical predicted protein [Scomber scombrus]|uniref:Uncharacterized protein n=1 Tax=Scomber scombrus TaxID=13677 RepID=A0AAV1MW06_SCOSC
MLADRYREHASDMYECWRATKSVSTYKSGVVTATNSGDSVTHGNAQLYHTLNGRSSCQAAPSSFDLNNSTSLLGEQDTIFTEDGSRVVYWT